MAGVCVCDVGAGGPLQSLVTLVSWQQAQPTKPTSIREEQTSNTKPEQNQQTQQEAKQKGGQQATHQDTHRQRSGQRKPKNEQERGGRQQAEASSSRTKKGGGRGRQQGQEEEAAQAEEKGACSSSGVLREDLDHPRVNTSVQEGRAPEQHSQHGVEGKAPHRAEAFVAMRRGEDRCQAVTTHHATGMTTGPSQIQPDTQREGPAEH